MNRPNKVNGLLRARRSAVGNKLFSLAKKVKETIDFINNENEVHPNEPDILAVVEYLEKMHTSLQNEQIKVEQPLEEFAEKRYQHGKRISEAIAKGEKY